MSTPVEFWFDPSCPWTWITSRWLKEVAPHRDLAITWKVMSLAVLNEDAEVDDAHRSFLPRALRYTRLLAAVRELDGQEWVGPLFDALGTRIHIGGERDADVVIAASLHDLGLPAQRIELSLTDEFDEPMRASHFEAIDRVGQEVGTPVIAVNGVAFFGPVVSPAPRGDAALALWDGVVAVASCPGFFELKRSRTVEPIFE